MTRTEVRTKQKAERLIALLEGRRSLLIVMQDNPDPDSIAAAAALRRIANAHVEVPCSIAYGGVIGRAENRAVAEYLGLNFRPMSEIDPTKYDAVALVDTQPCAGNNALPTTIAPHIVIDHHPARDETKTAEFSDVRPRYGAVSTILVEYLRELALEPAPPLATALLYGIRTDTQDLGPRATRADLAAAESLWPLVNSRMLSAIQRGSVPPSYYRTLAAALGHARVHGDCIVADLGEVANPDTMAEMADLFVRYEGVRWVLCYGVHDGRLLLSLRRGETAEAAGELMQRLVEGVGTGGGHVTAAGGQIDVANGGPSPDGARRGLRERFLREAGALRRGRALVRAAARDAG